MGNYYDEDKDELNDEEILNGIDEAKRLYEDGDLIEAASVMQEIVNAITSWRP